MEQENRAFSLMLRDALIRLEGKDPEDIAERSAVSYDKKRRVFSFSSFGKNITLSFPDYTAYPSVSWWHYLCILHYLDLSDKSPLKGEYISFAQITDGMVRGSGFDRRSDKISEEILSGYTQEQIRKKCMELGGEEIKTNADYSCLLHFMPRYPILLKIWFADDEFPAAWKMMVDRNDKYLTIEDAVTVGEILIELFRK